MKRAVWQLIAWILIVVTCTCVVQQYSYGQNQKPNAAAEIDALKMDNLRLRTQSRIKDVQALQLQLQTLQAQANQIQGDIQRANDDAVKLIEEWYKANGKTREGWDLNLATLEFSSRAEKAKPKEPPK
jgi:TolA-binding protein